MVPFHRTVIKKVKRASPKCSNRDVCCFAPTFKPPEAALNWSSGSLQALVSVSFPPTRNYQKKKQCSTAAGLAWSGPVCHKPTPSPSIHLVSLFSSFHQSHPQGRESGELKVESGAAKSGWNGSPLCGGKRGNAKENPQLWEPLCGWWTPRAVGTVQQRRRRERRVIVCMLTTQHEYNLWSYSSSPPSGWFSYLLRPLGYSC